MQSGRFIAIAAATLGLMCSAGGLLASGPAWAGDNSGRSIVYTPRDGVSKGTRVVGQSRGLSGPSITVLAPEDTGETTLAQPTLLWHSSAAITAAVEVVITDELTQKTVYETRLDGPVEAGIAAIPLGKLRVSLRTDRDYRWSVSVVRDPARRSLDLFASGTIRRADMPSPLAARLNSVGPADMPYFLAENGLWYDALAVLSVQISRNPDDRRLRGLRASLLDQVGLTEAAAADRM